MGRGRVCVGGLVLPLCIIQNVYEIPRGGTLRILPHHDHSSNVKMAPIAYQTQTLADPNHIQPVLP